jgi:exopolyphosphatase / guanosine-5'-triphosphate,3'-diphosphate pyrophosphatase
VAGTTVSRVAAVDIGTNTVRLLVVESGPPSVEVVRAHRVVGLGEGVDGTGVLGEAAMERTIQGLADLVASAGHVARFDAVATSATRDAANRDEFLDRAAEVLGVRPRVISGEEEARLSFLGATGGGGRDPRVVVDVGGGSTEVVFGRLVPEYARSVELGSVRLTERALPDRPASPAMVEGALAWAAHRLGGVDLPEDGVPAIGVAGTFTTLAAIDAGLPTHDRAVVHGWALEVGRVEGMVGALAPLTVAETAAIPALEPARAPVILAGAIKVLAVMRHLDLATIEVRETDLLDTLVAELA